MYQVGGHDHVRDVIGNGKSLRITADAVNSRADGSAVHHAQGHVDTHDAGGGAQRPSEQACTGSHLKNHVGPGEPACDLVANLYDESVIPGPVVDGSVRTPEPFTR